MLFEKKISGRTISGLFSGKVKLLTGFFCNDASLFFTVPKRR